MRKQWGYNDGMAESQNGYTVINREDCKFYTDIVDGLSLPLRPDDCGYVLSTFARRFNRRVEPLGRTETFGHSYRKIGGSDEWSNHASGTALDLNASQHPQGKSGTFTQAELNDIRELQEEFDDIIKWGGDYRTTKDEMHFEIDAPYGEVRHVAKILRKNNTVVLSRVQPGKTNFEVYLVKRALSRRGHFDGELTTYFGKGTREAYRDFQESLGYTGDAADGRPGVESLKALGFKVKEG